MPRFFRVSLQRLLTLPYVLLVFGLAASVAWFSYRAGERAVDAVSERLLAETVQRVRGEVQHQVGASATVLEAAMPVGAVLPADLGRGVAVLRSRLWIAATIPQDPNHAVYVGNAAGQFVGMRWPAGGGAQWLQGLEPQQPRTMFQLDGADAAPRDGVPEDRPFDPRERPWYRGARHAGREVWTPVYVDFGSHALVVSRSRPLADAAGQFTGVVGTDLSLQALEAFMRQLSVSPNGCAFVIEGDGNLIASSNAASVQRRADGSHVRFNAANAGSPLLAATYRELRGELATAPRDGAPVVRRFTGPDGALVEAGFTRVVDDAGLDWTAVVAIPRADFMVGVGDAVRRAALAGLVASGLAVLLGLAVLRWVARDLGRLSDAARRVGEGDLDGTIDIDRDDEIGELARNFRTMQQKLRTDRLTGLANREALLHRLAARIESRGRAAQRRRRADQQELALLFVDLDSFKTVNDRFGHGAGDRVLAVLGARLLAGVRDSDMVARYAGDEFIVLLDGVASVAAAEEVRRHLDAALRAPVDGMPGDTSVSLSGSIGIALHGRDGETAAEMIAAADADMYRRKPAAGTGAGEGHG